jgi:hypothetical protein
MTTTSGNLSGKFEGKVSTAEMTLTGTETVKIAGRSALPARPPASSTSDSARRLRHARRARRRGCSSRGSGFPNCGSLLERQKEGI